MSKTYTPAVRLAIPALGDQGWNVPIGNDFTLLDALAPVGGLCCTTVEQPSTSLNVAVAAGAFVDQAGAVQTFAGSASFGCTASLPNYLYLDGTAAWALTKSTSAFPAGPHVRIAAVLAGSSAITSVTDARQAFTVCGSVADGVNLALGTTTGTQIGTAALQKLGFFGKTPTTQPTVGAATAGATYTATEQAMLQAVHDALRTLGLGS